MNQQQPQQQINIRAENKELKGSYSNMMQVSHTKEEFILDFFLLSRPEGVLTSRIVMSPGHMKRTIAALQENMKRYEDAFGKIEESKVPEGGIGFKV